jgi:heme/copper-type cytochrome/quinol oxidase subunit 2
MTSLSMCHPADLFLCSARWLIFALDPQEHPLDAQFFTYDQVQEAERREAEAETRFVIGVVVASIVLVVLLLRAIAHVRRKIRPGEVPDATTKPPTMTLSYLTRVLGVVFYVFALAVMGFYLASCTDLVPEYQRLSAMQTVWLSAGFLWLGGICFRHADRLSMPIAEDVLRSDPRSPILFLRSFSEEETALSNLPWWYTSSVPDLLEEAVLSEFQKVGPVVGLTNRRLRSRPGTYSPYDTETEKWQERAEQLMLQAAAIVVVVTIGEGLAWEIRRISELGLLTRTVFVLPPSNLEEPLRWLISELDLPPDVKTDVVEVSRFGEKQPIAIIDVDSRLTTYLAHPDKGGYLLVAQRVLRDMAGMKATAVKNN